MHFSLSYAATCLYLISIWHCRIIQPATGNTLCYLAILKMRLKQLFLLCYAIVQHEANRENLGRNNNSKRKKKLARHIAAANRKYLILERLFSFCCCCYNPHNQDKAKSYTMRPTAPCIDTPSASIIQPLWLWLWLCLGASGVPCLSFN